MWESKSLTEIRDLRDDLYDSFKDKSKEEILEEIQSVALEYVEKNNLRKDLISRLDDIRKVS